MNSARFFLRDMRAAAAAEFALVLPLLAVLFLNVADISIYVWSKMQVDLAAQAAVGAARRECDGSTTAKGIPAIANCAALNTVMDSAVKSTSLQSSVTLGGTTQEGWYCSTSAGVLTPAASETEPCSNYVAGSTALPGDYISTTASYPFSPLFPGVSIATVLQNYGPNITSTAWMRLK